MFFLIIVGLTSISFEINQNQLENIKKYISDFSSKNSSKKGYNLRNRQCASFAYGVSQAAGIKELKMKWYEKNIIFGVTPKNLNKKIKNLNKKQDKKYEKN